MFKRLSTFHVIMLLVAVALLALHQMGLVSAVEAGLISAAGLGGMILDERNELCDATAVNTGGVASYLLGDVIDLGAAPGDLGPGDELYFVVQVDTSIASATGSFKFHLCSDAQAAIAVDGSATYHFSTGAALEAALVAGTLVCAVKLPYGTYERYLGVVQETITAAATAGKINAFLTSDVAKWKPYADAVA
jgi:uncharacterized protein YaiE (UPF0345 family)